MKANELNAEVDPFLHFLLGQVYQLEHEFDKAIKEFKTYEELAKNKYVEEYKKIMSKYKKECKFAKELTTQKNRYWVDFVPELSSEADDFTPTLSVDGEVLIFNSRRKNGHKANEYGQYDSDIYLSNFDGEKWSSPKSLGSPLNTEIGRAHV